MARTRLLPRARRRRPRGTLVLAVALAVSGGLSLSALSWGGVGSVGVVEGVAEVVDRPGGPVVNYLLVGSDSREGFDPGAPDAGAIGGTGDVSGQRSDTIMVLRYDRGSGAMAVLSLPRDLWVDIPGYRADRINSAYGRGPEVLVATVQSSLGLPVHHYLEVDFFGFKEIVDAVGGVEICVDTPVRDTQSGLDLPEAGCHRLDGVHALAYTRSRSYERWVDGEWRRDPTADLGRTERQRAFLQASLAAAYRAVLANPLRSGTVVDAVTASLSADGDFDLMVFASRLRPAAQGGLTPYALAVRGENIDGKSVLRLAAGSEQVLAYFAGRGPAPEQG